MHNITRLFAVLSIALVCSVAYAKGAVPKTFERQKTPTPLTQIELLNVLDESHVAVFATRPSNTRLAMAWAQVALENGRGRRMWNHNIGNVGPAPSHPPVPYYVHSNITTYRSFDTFVAGGTAYWKVLKRCKFALMSFDVGNPAQAARNLKSCGYYGADVALYSSAMIGLYSFAMKELIPNAMRETVKNREEKLYSDWCNCSYSSMASGV